MLLMGDEVRRSQQGNNNAFDQDNEISWFDWDKLERHHDLLRFARLLIQYHQNNCLFRDRQLWTSSQSTDIRWHGVQLDQPDWGHDSRSLAFELINQACEERMHVMLNAYWDGLEFELPELPDGWGWRRLVDTSLPSPDDISQPPVPLRSGTRRYRLGPRSSVVLVAEPA